MKKLLSGNEALARGALEARIEIACGYPGTPSSEILENVSKYKEIYSEWSVNEKVAMDAAAGAAYSGRRALVTTKQVGMNVMSDSLFYTAYTGAEAALVVVTADDPGLFSSQNEQDNRHYAKLGKFPMLEPCDSQECKDFMIEAVDMSERFDTPVVIRTTMRTSHSKSVVELGTPGSYGREVGPFPRNIEKYNSMCTWARKRHYILEQRLLDIEEWSNTWPGNRIEWGGREYGFIAGGIIYEYVKQVFPEASILKLGMCYPLPKKLIREFADGVRNVIVVEELDPFIEEQVRAMGIPARGKDIFSICGELLPEDIAESCRKAGILKDTAPAFSDTSESLPSRSPLLCSGCPHRSTFYNLSQMKVPVAGDIGCYNLGTLPPFNAQHTMGAMGASVGVLHGMGLSGLPEPAVCTIGDGTFFHAGVAPLLNMVHNKGKGTVIIMDNRTTAMTGHQDNPGIEATLSLGTVAPVDIAGLCRACGVEKVLTADAFDLAAVRKALEECTAYDGVSVLITRGDCVFVSRSPKPARVVDADKCIACGKCIQSGCPSVVLSDEKHPRTGKRKARIEPVTCVGCGICAQICPVHAISGPEQA
ncbi:thiamine pyrophosphate-dependent enzyme [Bilophila wadsworthia]|uniref:thiamine pyrophosphate-dependent enzyme n=1 Tax=Bilophila wadsworthia TaxID=35833 RepID=UPI0026DDA76F|nr:thiamine pyrophosphate-dependent enzyme [Bilophila wadsworthia]